MYVWSYTSNGGIIIVCDSEEIAMMSEFNNYTPRISILFCMISGINRS